VESHRTGEQILAVNGAMIFGCVMDSRSLLPRKSVRQAQNARRGNPVAEMMALDHGAHGTVEEHQASFRSALNASAPALCGRVCTLRHLRFDHAGPQTKAWQNRVREFGPISV